MSRASLTVGTVKFGEYETWYQSCGNIRNGSIPVILLHGGPGAGSDYMWPIQDLLAFYQVPTIVYDQVGCGKSTRLRDKSGDASFWTVDLFKRELANLIKELSLEEYHLWGHNWGGMLAAEFAADKALSKGLSKLLLHSTLAAQSDWDAQGQAYRATLPTHVQEILQSREDDGAYDSDEYEKAAAVYYAKYLCRMEPMPDSVEKSMANLREDTTAYTAMRGPFEFRCTGSLKEWTIKDRLHLIDVPTLIINGEYDQASHFVTRPLFQGIQKAKWVTINDSSHMAHLEHPEKVQRAAREFFLD